MGRKVTKRSALLAARSSQKAKNSMTWVGQSLVGCWHRYATMFYVDIHTLDQFMK